MAIQRFEIEGNYLAFKGGFAAEFCPGVNVLIGGNGTGKTTLIKTMYSASSGNRLSVASHHILQYKYKSFTNKKATHTVYLPEKDILEHAQGLLTFISQKQTGFDIIYKEFLIAAQDTPTKEQSEMQTYVRQKIAAVTGGEVFREPVDGSFYTLKTDGTRIPFSNEASGYKKLGFLGLLVRCGQLEPGSVLFWDEPENSLNPANIETLVEILLELSRNKVQIFIATHSELLARYFAVDRRKEDSVQFISLYKDGEQIKASTDERFDLLAPNSLMSEPVKLYELEIEKGLGGNG